MTPSNADSSPLLDAREQLGAALRQLGHDVIGHRADEAALRELTVVLREWSSRLTPGETRSREREGFHEHWDTDMVDGDIVVSFPDRPMSGPASPWSVEPDVRKHGDGVIATVTFHAAHEGAPDRCHGGIVAGLFDDVLGSVLSVIGSGGFTGELSVRFDAAVPLHRELVCRCWLDRIEGRKLFLLGELTDDGRLVSSAKAVFIQPRTAPTQSTFDPA